MYTMTLPDGNTLNGQSRSNSSSVFKIEELRIQFDIGKELSGKNPRHLFLTHLHLDHILSIMSVFTYQNEATIYIPEMYFDQVGSFLRQAHAMLDGGELFPNIVAVSEGIPIDIEITQRTPRHVGKKVHPFRVTPFLCDHSVPCYGYRFDYRKNQFNPLYEDYASEEKKAIIEAGGSLRQDITVPYLVFLGDTTTKVFEDNPELLSYPVVITECLYLTPELKERTNGVKHTHWEDLKPFVESHPDTKFVLHHFSLRHNRTSVLQHFQQENLGNVIPFI